MIHRPLDVRQQLKQLVEALAGFCRAEQDRRILEKEQFAAHGLFVFLLERGRCVFLFLPRPRRGRCERGGQIPFVDQDHAAASGLRDQATDAFVLLGHTGCGVHRQHREVAFADTALGAHQPELVNRGLDLAAMFQPGGVDQDIRDLLFAAHEGERDIDRVAGGARDLADDGAVALQDGVDQRGLAGVWPADDGDPQCRRFFARHGRRETAGCRIEQRGHAVAVDGGNRECLGKPERAEFVRSGRAAAVVHLVDGEGDRLAAGP